MNSTTDNWSYMPSGCPVSQPVNTNMYGGTYAGRGPVQQNGNTCSNPVIGKCEFYITEY